MSFLRPVAGYILLEQKRCTDIRSELKIFSLPEKKRKLLRIYVEYIENENRPTPKNITKLQTQRTRKNQTNIRVARAGEVKYTNCIYP